MGALTYFCKFLHFYSKKNIKGSEVGRVFRQGSFLELEAQPSWSSGPQPSSGRYLPSRPRSPPAWSLSTNILNSLL